MDLPATLRDCWREDPASSYHRWFLWKERLKNFRSIRRGLALVVEELRSDAVGRRYRGSSLETVVKSVAEQWPVYRGADHAFLCKPKLRIPDIYENRDNQLASAAFLDQCACCDTEAEVLAAIHRLDARQIKGPGPATANLLYFLHPTIAPPSNTAIGKGYELLTGVRVPFGKWSAYLAMRQGMLDLSTRHRNVLSNDLGAIASFLLDVGSARCPAPPFSSDATVDARQAWRDALEPAVQVSAAVAIPDDVTEDLSHTQVQGWLRDLGKALGFDVWIASSDQ